MKRFYVSPTTTRYTTLMSESALDVVLYGADPTPAIVAVEPDSEGRKAILFVRQEDGQHPSLPHPIYPLAFERIRAVF